MVLSLLLCGVFFFGCKREYPNYGDNPQTNTSKPSINQLKAADESDANAPALPQGTVIFDKAEILLVPGEEWDLIKTSISAEGSSICIPVLNGLGGNNGAMIRVFTTEEKSEVETAISILKTQVESNPNTIKNSFKLTEFNSVFGVHGTQVSYDYLVKRFLTGKKFRAQVYLFQNSKKRCVAINFITFADKDSARIQEMIRDTLQLN